MRIIYVALLGVSLTGCAVSYNPVAPIKENLNVPEVGVVTKAQIGDPLLIKGHIRKIDSLNVITHINGSLYTIPTGYYEQVGYKDNKKYFAANGVRNSGWVNPASALYVMDGVDNKVCAVDMYSSAQCYDASYDIKQTESAHAENYQQAKLLT